MVFNVENIIKLKYNFAVRNVSSIMILIWISLSWWKLKIILSVTLFKSTLFGLPMRFLTYFKWKWVLSNVYFSNLKYLNLYKLFMDIQNNIGII